MFPPLSTLTGPRYVGRILDRVGMDRGFNPYNVGVVNTVHFLKYNTTTTTKNKPKHTVLRLCHRVGGYSNSLSVGMSNKNTQTHTHTHTHTEKKKKRKKKNNLGWGRWGMFLLSYDD